VPYGHHVTDAPPGPLIARGRAADVYAVGERRVLRRYRTEYDVTDEAATMRHLAEHGYPVPAVHEASGRDIVMDRVQGPVMLDLLGRRPWMLWRQARLLARLQLDLAEISTEGLTLAVVDDGPTVIVHGDLHPGNVMLSPRGPVVIDWTNACLGSPGTDQAVTWALLHAGDAPTSGALEATVVRLGRSIMLRAFLAASDQQAARAALPAVVQRRQADPNLSAAEKALMAELLR
jgi:aminoglycoside phosphotransferase (APT) family kinase protein